MELSFPELLGEESLVLEVAVEETVVVWEGVEIVVVQDRVVDHTTLSVTSFDAFLQTASEVLLPGIAIPLLHLQSKKIKNKKNNAVFFIKQL